jgi:hypothetical protein
VFPLMMGAQRLEMSSGLAVEKSDMQTGVAGTRDILDPTLTSKLRTMLPFDLVGLLDVSL